MAEYLAAGGPVQSLDLHTKAKADFLERFVAEVLAPAAWTTYEFPGPAGTLAVEAALKLARKVTGRTTVVAFSGGFHGVSLGSLAAKLECDSGRRAAYLATPWRPSRSSVVAGSGRGGALEHELRPCGGRERPAAVLLESVQGEGGLHAGSAGWLRRVRRLAADAGAVVILDDIQAGCGRTGAMLSTERVREFEPDLVCLSRVAVRDGHAHGDPADPPGPRRLGAR